MSDARGQQEASSPTVGRTVARVLALLVLGVVVLYVLFFHVFPWVERTISNPSLDGAVPAVNLQL